MMNQHETEQPLLLHPIGRIVNLEKEGHYSIKIDGPYRAGLKQLDRFSHVMVFWWAYQMDREDRREILSTT
jgi:tRNA (Thr-GGU) A37 N-methylase